MAISEIIKYEGDNKTFIWKHPAEDFNTTTQLIVNESHEALFFLNGQALDLFGPGRHTLEAQNIPFIRRILNMPTGDKTPFHCEVYFINKTEQMAIKWGTDSRVEFMEPTYNFPIQIGASGEMSLRAEDSRKLAVKLVGTESSLSQEGIVRYFRAFLMTRSKAYLARTIREKKISIFEIDEHLNELSEDIKQIISADFMEYGVILERFFITTVIKPEGDKAYERFKELHFRKYADITEAEIRQKIGIIDQQTQAQRTIIEAQGISQKRSIEGYTYQQERSFDVSEKVAQNEGVGEFSNMGIGLGLMTGLGSTVGSAVGGMVGNAFNPNMQKAAVQQAAPHFCENCGASVTDADAFCNECGNKLEIVAVSFQSCSNCAFKFQKPSKFCPKCGAKREGI